MKKFQNNIKHIFHPSLHMTNLSHIVKQHKIWQKTKSQEIKALEDNDTWEITILREGRKVVGCKGPTISNS